MEQVAVFVAGTLFGLWLESRRKQNKPLLPSLKSDPVGESEGDWPDKAPDERFAR